MKCSAFADAFTEIDFVVGGNVTQEVVTRLGCAGHQGCDGTPAPFDTGVLAQAGHGGGRKERVPEGALASGEDRESGALGLDFETRRLDVTPERA